LASLFITERTSRRIQNPIRERSWFRIRQHIRDQKIAENRHGPLLLMIIGYGVVSSFCNCGIACPIAKLNVQFRLKQNKVRHILSPSPNFGIHSTLHHYPPDRSERISIIIWLVPNGHHPKLSEHPIGTPILQYLTQFPF
jgi:hypothetical protein